MFPTGPGPVARSTSQPVIAMRLVILAILAALVLAGSAQGAEGPEAPSTGTTPQETSSAGPPAEGPASTPPTGTAAGETTTPETTGGTEESTASSSAGSTPEEPAAPAGSTTEEPASTPTVTTPEPVPVTVTLPTPEESIPATPTPPTSEPSSPTTPTGGEVTTATPIDVVTAELPAHGGGAVSEKAPEASLSPAASGQGPPGGGGSEVPAPAAASPIGPSATIQQLSGESTTTPATNTPKASSRSGMTAVQQAGGFACELAVLRPAAEGCSTGWSTNRSYVSTSSVGFISAMAPRPVVSTEAPAGSGHGGSVDGGRPLGPTPGPAPSGASGGSAMGGSGLAFSAFLTLAGLLLLAAPRALRQLRLSCQPWLTSFFVLIPERPG